MLYIRELIFLLCLVLGSWFWIACLRARELATAEAQAVCEREGVQLLDQTVSCRSIRPARNTLGRLTLKRTYEFDYSSSGFDRYAGMLVLMGDDVALLDVSAHKPVVEVHLSLSDPGGR